MEAGAAWWRRAGWSVPWISSSWLRGSDDELIVEIDGAICSLTLMNIRVK